MLLALAPSDRAIIDSQYMRWNVAVTNGKLLTLCAPMFALLGVNCCFTTGASAAEVQVRPTSVSPQRLPFGNYMPKVRQGDFMGTPSSTPCTLLGPICLEFEYAVVKGVTFLSTGGKTS